MPKILLKKAVGGVEYRPAVLDGTSALPPAQLSWESVPGRATGILPGIHDAPIAQRLAFHHEIHDALFPPGDNSLPAAFGLHHVGSFVGPGAYIEDGEMSNNPSTQTMLHLSGHEGDHISDEHKNAVEALAATIGHLTKQHSVGYHQLLHAKPGQASATKVDLGRMLTQDEIEQAYHTVMGPMATHGDPALVSAPTGLHALNFTDMPYEHFEGHVADAVRSAVDPRQTLTATPFGSDGDLVGNDWQESPGGEDYLKKADEAGYGDVCRQLLAKYAPHIAAIHDKFNAMYGWQEPQPPPVKKSLVLVASGTGLDALRLDSNRRYQSLPDNPGATAVQKSLVLVKSASEDAPEFYSNLKRVIGSLPDNNADRKSGAGNSEDMRTAQANRSKYLHAHPDELLQRFPDDVRERIRASMASGKQLGHSTLMLDPEYASASKQLSSDTQSDVDKVRGLIRSRVGKEEQEWGRPEEYLSANPGKVDKAALLAHVRENLPQLSIQERNPRNGNLWHPDRHVREYVAHLNDTHGPVTRWPAEAREQLTKMGAGSLVNPPTRFDYAQMPGGENYREHLIKWDNNPGQAFAHPHYPSDQNWLAHVRMNERPTDDGKRALHLETVQSDWHQQGRENGYGDNITSVAERMRREKVAHDAMLDRRRYLHANPEELMKHFGPGNDPLDIAHWRYQTEQGHSLPTAIYNMDPDHERLLNAWVSADNDLESSRGPKVPDAPFKGRGWHELAMKHALYEAAKGGHDQLTWASGEEHGKRWGDYPERTEGMKKFYGSIDPTTGQQTHGMLGNFLNGYAKKWGQQVGVGHVMSAPEPGGDKRQGMADFREKLPIRPVKVHSLNITPEMRQSILTEGQPMWGNGDALKKSLLVFVRKAVNPTNPDLDVAARQYREANGLPENGYGTAPIHEESAKRLADLWDTAEHNPNDARTQRSYDAFKSETLAQYHHLLNSGYTIEPYEGEGEPYANSAEMLKDLRDNKHLSFLRTESGYGSGAVQSEDHPMLQETGIKTSGYPLLYNDLFRGVHDALGHGPGGHQFGPQGEESAWREHAGMYSPLARGALLSESKAQNAWVNYGSHMRRADGSVPRKGEADFVPLQNRPFSPQKAALMPEEYWTPSQAPNIQKSLIFLRKGVEVTEAEHPYNVDMKQRFGITDPGPGGTYPGVHVADAHHWIFPDGTISNDVTGTGHANAARGVLRRLGALDAHGKTESGMSPIDEYMSKAGAIRLLIQGHRDPGVEIHKRPTTHQLSAIYNVLRAKGWRDMMYDMYHPDSSMRAKSGTGVVAMSRDIDAVYPRHKASDVSDAHKTDQYLASLANTGGD